MSKEPRDPITRHGMVRCARHFLDWLSYMYVDRVMVLDGGQVIARWPEVFYEQSFEDWSRKLADAPPALRKPATLRLVVAEAVAESQLRMTGPLERWASRPRVVELLTGFGRAVNTEGFLATKGKTFREWLPGALALPAPPEGAPTPDDQHLRARVDALSAEERLAFDVADLPEASTLRDLSPLATLPALRKVRIWDAPMLLDLSPLAQIETLEELIVTAPLLTDLAPIGRMRALRSLKLNVTEGLDLAPLAALTRLEELDVTVPQDLAPAAALGSLKKLSIASRHRSLGLEMLRELAGLTHLTLQGFHDVRSADFVRDLPKLVFLDLGGNDALADISAVAALKDLEELRVSSTPLRSLDAIKGLSRLRALTASHCPLDVWPPFRDLPALAEFEAHFAALTCGTAGLEEAVTLRSLRLGFQDGAQFADLTPLANLTALEELNLTEIASVADLSPLRGLTRLRVLDVGDTSVSDLSPIAGMTEIERLSCMGLPIATVEPLAGMKKLTQLQLQRCERLRSIQPLASCTALTVLECEDCDALRGPKTLEELRAPPPPPAKRFPSAGLPVKRPGEATAIDVRGHLPRQPPENWSQPERESGDGDTYWLDAENALVMVMLWRRDVGQLLMVQLWPRSGVRMNDKQAARILRHFRATDPFVETDEMLTEGFTHGRSFIAIPHPTSADTWAGYRERGALLRIEANDDGGPWDVADVRHHLPSPLPPGWSTRPTKLPLDEAVYVSTPAAELTLHLRPFDKGETVKFAVTVMPPAAQFGARVGDATTRALLTPLRGRCELIERLAGPFARAPGMRIFVGYPKGGGPA